MKKVILVIVSLVCVAALTACASSPAQPSVVAAASASQPAAASQSAAPAPASSAATASASTQAAPSATALGLEQIAAAINQTNAAGDASGNKITAAVSGNTLTMTETLNQDMSPSSFPSSMQTTYNAVLQSTIDQMAIQDPAMPSCTWVMIIQNKSGEQLVKVTADYTAK
jgi:hypothetical protein